VGQSQDIVKVRAPGHRRYKNEPVAAQAVSEWEYAVMAANAYRDHWSNSNELVSNRKDFRPLVEIQTLSSPSDCVADEKTPLPLPGWYRWADFPVEDPALEEDANNQQLFFEVWQKNDPGDIVAIVFRGTVPSKWKSWVADFRWFLPFHRDQYTVAAGKLAEEFAKHLAERLAAGLLAQDVKVVSVGHSLGGGLAQQLAYALPLLDSVPRVSLVYAFDPSPVTGYFSVDAKLRDANKKSLAIYRIFEYGEILAYLRLLLSYIVPPSARAPAVSEIRYNFDSSGDLVQNHSITVLACGISRAAGRP
jgi:pimeloyl-ACP methyl ester carboxylesterase